MHTKNISLMVGVAVFLITATAAHAQDSQIAIDCRAQHPGANSRALVARIQCAAQHPLAYQADALQQSEMNYGLSLIPKLKSGAITYSQAKAYLDQHWQWQAAQIDNQRQRQVSFVQHMLAAQRWQGVANYAEGLSTWQEVIVPSLRPRGF